jgi:hypothetical protein
MDFDIDAYEVSERLPKNNFSYDEEPAKHPLKKEVASTEIRDKAIQTLEQESTELAKSLLAPLAIPPPRAPARFKFAFKLPNPWAVGAIFIVLLLLLRK